MVFISKWLIPLYKHKKTRARRQRIVEKWCVSTFSFATQKRPNLKKMCFFWVLYSSSFGCFFFDWILRFNLSSFANQTNKPIKIHQKTFFYSYSKNKAKFWGFQAASFGRHIFFKCPTCLRLSKFGSRFNNLWVVKIYGQLVKCFQSGHKLFNSTQAGKYLIPVSTVSYGP